MKLRNETKVGILAIAAIVVLVLGFNFLKGQNVFFAIEKGVAPLSATTGLYVVTCTANQAFYYAVTVTNLATNKEVKDLLSGKNYLTSPVS